ncbi:lipocalin family protein [Seonamhaeicola marinus]|uniref:Lipocalin-like domain-containing protein n=1 Tax=Seonamhaeicola marinus TaxID=1912246 RepID=A0A5D0HKP1_9FLAO|nr:lipocalin family protein [Seonamhaeicola marinus]TYA71953.1 hypothetical protein FUA24_20610 [Seonamhaeicola marinus]
MKNESVTIVIAVVMTILFSASGCAQETQKELLTTKWDLDAYNIKNKTYPPEPKEQDDFIQFNADNTFISKSEGNIETGNYTLNSQDDYIDFKDGTKVVLRAYIVELSTKALILKYDIGELRDIEIIYKPNH